MRIVLPLLLAALTLGGCATSPLGPRPRPGPPVLTRAPVEASEVSGRHLECWCARRRNRNSLLLGAAAVGAVVAYGGLYWGYASGEFGFDDEGWFGEDTTYGGADKAGHFVTAHIGTAALAAVHRHWGYSRREAALRGALISLATLTTIEIADGTSERHGFSVTDLCADVAGCAFGYLHETSPWVRRVLDVRWEWVPNTSLSGENDVSTDYENSTYLLAANVGALRNRGPGWLDFVDLQAGYRARGYAFEDQDDERWVFVGVGLNVANVLRRVGFRWASVFDYFQVPFVSLRLGYELNEGRSDLIW